MSLSVCVGDNDHFIFYFVLYLVTLKIIEKKNRMISKNFTITYKYLYLSIFSIYIIAIIVKSNNGKAYKRNSH